MKFKQIAILTSEESWFVPYARKFRQLLNREGYNASLSHDYRKISNKYEIVFILSYFHMVEKQHLNKHKHNLVVHESSLPRGRGWAPLFWQILHNRSKIPIVLFEAAGKADKGYIYIKDYLLLKGHELNNEIRKAQAEKTIAMCLNFLRNYNKINPSKQKGKTTYYRKRSSEDSRLDISKSLKSQFNLLRIVNNDKFPAFFIYKGHKYILNIRKEK